MVPYGNDLQIAAIADSVRDTLQNCDALIAANVRGSFRSEKEHLKMKTSKYKVDALNLNDVLVSQKIEAVSAAAAAKRVTDRNKYLRVQSVTLMEDPQPSWENELDRLK